MKFGNNFTKLFLLFVLVKQSHISFGKKVNKKLLIFAVTTELTDGYFLFRRSLRTYGLKLQKILATGLNYPGHALKVNLLNKELENYKDRSDVIVLFTDTYDVIFTAGEEEIIKAFESFRANVVFSAESNCSPSPSLAPRFPEVEKGYRFLNSGGFIGYAPYVFSMLPQQSLDEEFDDQLYYSLSYLDGNFRESMKIVLDSQANIFQSLHGAKDNVSLLYLKDDTKLVNHYTNSSPLIIHGNGNDGKLLLHTFSSYLAKSWTTSKGCLSCNEGRMDLIILPVNEYPTVLMGVFIDKPTPFLKEKLQKIVNLSYPKKQIFLFVSNKIRGHEECVQHWIKSCQDDFMGHMFLNSSVDNITISRVRELAIKKCLNISCDLFFSVDSEVTIENPDTLKILISYKKTALAPVMTETGTSKATFWGGITEDFQEVETFDYMNIITNKRRGIWNVPQLFHIYVIWRYILENPFYDGGLTGLSVHPDIAISHIAKITKNFSMFLFAINMEYYGHLSNMDNLPSNKNQSDLGQVARNSKDWEDKYLHPQFHNYLDKTVTISTNCSDVFVFPLFKNEFCQEMIKMIESTIKENGYNVQAKENASETMNYFSDSSININMRDIEYEDEWRHIIKKYVSLMAEKVFQGYHSKGEAGENFVKRSLPGEYSNTKLKYNLGAVAFTMDCANELNSQDGSINFLCYNCSIGNVPDGWAVLYPGRLTHSNEVKIITKWPLYTIKSFIDP